MQIESDRQWPGSSSIPPCMEDSDGEVSMEDEDEEDIEYCDLCGERPEVFLIEDIGCCRECEGKARQIVWNRRYQ